MAAEAGVRMLGLPCILPRDIEEELRLIKSEACGIRCLALKSLARYIHGRMDVFSPVSQEASWVFYGVGRD